ncbi:hypothetical protein D3C80_998960 [compost metagenome]
MDDIICLTRKTTDKATNIGGSAADIHHHGIGKPGEKSRTTHRIGRAGSEAVHGVCGSYIRKRHGAVILCKIERRLYTRFAQRIRKCLYRGPAKRLQGGIQKCDVFALQKPDTAQRVGKRDACIGDHRTDNLRRPHLALRGQRRKGCRNGDRGNACIADFHRRFTDFIRDHRHQRTAIVFMATMNHEDQRIDGLVEILRPVAHGRQ